MVVNMMMEVEPEVDYEKGCCTPKRSEFRIPEAVAPPPAPKKKAFWVGKKKKNKKPPQPPKNGYFNPPDLELLFAVTPVQQAWA
ncbi:hypothetical protein C1H46_013939 [Malus baccata]|uniref:Uncharacterized protein n=1 Tax=Malus baccata TaxID=106549 RepID=A0A540MNR0_MALBA|nr:hypothetical protein C1H46_013939 [Malus baccata]